MSPICKLAPQYPDRHEQLSVYQWQMSVLRAVGRIVRYSALGRRPLLFGWRMRVSSTQTAGRQVPRLPELAGGQCCYGQRWPAAGWVRAEALAGFVADVGIALGPGRTIDATNRLP